MYILCTEHTNVIYSYLYSLYTIQRMIPHIQTNIADRKV